MILFFSFSRLSVHWLRIHHHLSCHRISGTMNQPLSGNKFPEPKGLKYLPCSSQSPLLHTCVPLASLFQQTSPVHTATNKAAEKRSIIVSLNNGYSIFLLSLCFVTSCLDFNLPPTSIMDAMLDKLKGDWFSQRRNENIVAVEPLPYENITTRFPAYTTRPQTRKGNKLQTNCNRFQRSQKQEEKFVFFCYQIAVFVVDEGSKCSVERSCVHVTDFFWY